MPVLLKGAIKCLDVKMLFSYMSAGVTRIFETRPIHEDNLNRKASKAIVPPQQAGRYRANEEPQKHLGEKREALLAENTNLTMGSSLRRADSKHSLGGQS